MTSINVQVVREYIEDVINHKNFDHIFEYCSQDCILRFPPYIGLGLFSDDRSDERIVLIEIAPNSPAAGKLQVNDELVRVVGAGRVWESFRELKSGLWGQGIAGTALTVTIRRKGKLMEIPITRGRVEGFDMLLSKQLDIWRDDMLKNWPDLKVEVKIIFGEGDLVACYSINSGTNQEFHQSAIWSEYDIFRLKGEKIVEIWGLEDNLAVYKQLGYQIFEPAEQPAT